MVRISETTSDAANNSLIKFRNADKSFIKNETLLSEDEIKTVNIVMEFLYWQFRLFDNVRNFAFLVYCIISIKKPKQKFWLQKLGAINVCFD